VQKGLFQADGFVKTLLFF